MANRINRRKDTEGSRPPSQDAAANSYSDSFSSPRIQHKVSPPYEDLIVSLASAHENRRARQVTEWERIRQHHFPLSM